MKRMIVASGRLPLVALLLCCVLVLSSAEFQPVKAFVDPATITIIGFITISTVASVVPSFISALGAQPIFPPSKPTVRVNVDVPSDSQDQLRKDLDRAKKSADAVKKIIEIINKYRNQGKLSTRKIEFRSDDPNSPVYYYCRGKYYVPGKFIFVRTFVDSSGIRWVEYSRWPKETTSFVAVGYR